MADTYVIGKEFPKIAECVISSTEDGRYVLVDVANGTEEITRTG